MWAFACGAISTGLPLLGQWHSLLIGIALCGPLLCASSQAVNDWFDRHVDAVNEPSRPIPSGRMPGYWGLGFAIAWSGLALGVSLLLGRTVLLAALVGIALSFAYSAPPVRLKLNGWLGNLACAVCYEGMAWLTGALVMMGGARLSNSTISLALLYSLGAHGIMTLNDFKSISGDRRFGVASLPVQYGARRAALIACAVMLVPQLVVTCLLLSWHRPGQAIAVTGLMAAQVLLMVRFLKSPVERALWYSGFGVPLYVAGMMVSAFAARGVAA